MLARLASACALCAIAVSPAHAAVLGSPGVTLDTSPTVFRIDVASFTFTYDAAAAASFDPNPYSVMTGGTGQTSAFGGFLGIPLVPSAFDQRGVLIDNNLFPSFAAFPSLTPIPFSLTPSDLPLRYMSGADSYFGYARLNGNGTLDFAFESQANAAIIGGSPITGPLPSAIPEPAAWAMLLLGFAAVGSALRAKRRTGTIAVRYC